MKGTLNRSNVENKYWSLNLEVLIGFAGAVWVIIYQIRYFLTWKLIWCCGESNMFYVKSIANFILMMSSKSSEWKWTKSLNKQLLTADKVWSSYLVGWLTFPYSTPSTCYYLLHTASDFHVLDSFNYHEKNCFPIAYKLLPELFRYSQQYQQYVTYSTRQLYRSYTRAETLIVATIYLQLIQNRYMFRSFTILHCSHQHCVQPVASDVEVVGYL